VKVSVLHNDILCNVSLDVLHMIDLHRPPSAHVESTALVKASPSNDSVVVGQVIATGKSLAIDGNLYTSASGSGIDSKAAVTTLKGSNAPSATNKNQHLIGLPFVTGICVVAGSSLLVVSAVICQ
jgi:hypothetical protein